MADMLATPADLKKFPDLAGLTDETATFLLEIATSIIQGETGQILVAVANDSISIMGTTDSWLDLPQRPVTAIASVEIEGDSVTDYKRYAARLWRGCGWSRRVYEPATIAVVYSHGYAEGDRGLALARSAALMLAASVGAGPNGVVSESIDDYQVTYERMQAKMDSAPSLKTALAKAYGRKAGLVRVG